MIYLPFSQRILMFIALGTLVLTGTSSVGMPAESRTSKSKEINNFQFLGIKNQYPCLILLLCCLCNEAVDFVGVFIILGSICVSLYASNDSRYVTKKFAAYHFFALLLMMYSNIYFEQNNFDKGSVCHMLAFGILIAIYPFNSWLDSFFLRISNLVSSIWLVVIRTIIIAFSIPITYKIVEAGNTSLIDVLIGITLIIVPILIFSRLEIRRIASCLACWQSGYIWMFARIVDPEHFHIITMMAISQGIFLGIISQIAISLHIEKSSDSIDNIIGLLDRNYFSAVFFLSSLGFLIVLPVVFAFRKGMPDISNIFLAMLVSSMVIPIMFFRKILGLMKQSPVVEEKF